LDRAVRPSFFQFCIANIQNSIRIVTARSVQ
jgi:hypothetical protein